MIKLYPDQEECKRNVIAALNAERRALVVACTGWGKTILFGSITQWWLSHHDDAMVIIIAHRDDLLEQARDKYHRFDPSAIVGKIGSGTHDYGSPITVAGIDTISRAKHLEKLSQMISSSNHVLAIWDECHHCPAPKYQKVYDVLKGASHLGVTATPDRLDGKSLDDMFGKPVFTMSTIDAIKLKRLCNVKAIAVRTETSLDEIKSRKNKDGELDFDEQALARAIDTTDRNRRVVDAYREHGEGKQAVAFCINVNHAHNLCSAFNEQGIPAIAVIGGTDTEERNRIYEAYERGEYKVIVTILVLTEGWDCVHAKVAIMVRPTQSRALYTQCIGRVLRLIPGLSFDEQCALILDITDNIIRHKLTPPVNAKKLLDIKEDETVLESEERRAKEEIARIERVRKLKEQREKDEVVDLFASPFQWKENPQYSMSQILEVGSIARIAIFPCKDGSGLFEVWARLSKDNFQSKQKWSGAQPYLYAMQFAETQAQKIIDDPVRALKFLDLNADWRKREDPATDKQLNSLIKNKIPYMEGITKREASELIGRFMEAKGKKKFFDIQRKAERKEA